MRMTHGVLEQLKPFNQPVNRTVDQAKDALVEASAKALDFVKARPGTCLLAAVAVGFLIGRVLTRA